MATKPKKPAKEKAPKAKKSNPKADQAAKTKRASKGTKAVQAPPEPQEGARQLPGKAFVKSLAKDVLVQMERSATAGGAAGQMISDAVKKKGLPAKAFKDGLKLLRMGRRDPASLRTYLDDMEFIKECLEIEKLAGDSLFEPREGAQSIEDEGDETSGEADENASEADTEAEAAEAEPDNVHRLGRGRDAA